MRYGKAISKLIRPRSLDSLEETFSRHRKSFDSAVLLVRIFYGCSLFLLATRLSVWDLWLRLEAITPLWPVYWVKLAGIQAAVHLIIASSLAAALLCVLWPEKRIFRILFFITLLEYLAFNYSFGKISHGWHGWLGASFFLIFLPDGKRANLERSISARQLYLTAFVGTQAICMLFYSLSGFWKVTVGVLQFFRGEVHAFAPSALAYQIAKQLVQKNSDSLLGPFIIEHALIGWPLYLSAIYLELFAIVAVCRPSLHRFWGICLILFHIGTYLTMMVNFSINILLLVLLFVCSPFHPPQTSWRNILSELPIFGTLTRKVFRKPFTDPDLTAREN